MTFIEILVVLAILGGLLAVTILKVVPVLSRGKYAAVALGVDQLKKASLSYVTKPGSLGVLPLSEGTIPDSQLSVSGGATAADVAKAATIDQMLVAEGFLDKTVNITLAGQNPVPAGAGVTWNVTTQKWTATAAPTADYSGSARVETVMSDPNASPDIAAGTNFNLNGDGVTRIPANIVVEYMAIPNCPAQAAWELSNFIDGPAMTQADNTTADARGAVAYAQPITGFTTVYVYVTQQ